MIFYTHFCKLRLHLTCIHKTSSTPLICYFQKKNTSSSLLLVSVRCISRVTGDDRKSFIVSYLIDNCGLSPKSALSASKYLHFKTPANPDSVLSFLRSHGFSESQITKIIHKYPAVLASNPEKTLLPKIQFFHSKGFSTLDTVKILSMWPKIMHSSLENQLIPAYNVIQGVLPSQEEIVTAIKRSQRIMFARPQDHVARNMKMLKDTGLAHSNIVWLLKFHPKVLVASFDRIAEILEEVKRMGFKPSLRSFAIAMVGMYSLSKSTWERKCDVFGKWGWSREEIVVAVGKSPWVMMISENKIMKMMDYYVNQMGWNSAIIAQNPLLMGLSLEKRVIPRISVIQFLQSKGLIRSTSMVKVLMVSEKLFLQKFVTPYAEEASQLLKLYREKLNGAKCE